MCDRIDELIRRWERTGRLTPRELSIARDHIRECRACASAYGPLLPLLRRDAVGRSSQSIVTDSLPGSFTERLMSRLPRGAAPARPARRTVPARRPPTDRWSRSVRLLLIVGLGAALVVVAGFLGWFWGVRPRGEEVLVRFELVAPEARSVNLVGDFNDWDPEGLVMKDVTGDGHWRIAIRLKKGRVYTYNFLMDDQHWIADPSSLRQVEDGFGGRNSVLEL